MYKFFGRVQLKKESGTIFLCDLKFLINLCITFSELYSE